MIYLKNKKTGQIGKFSRNQGINWKNATSQEINNFNIEQQKLQLLIARKKYLKSTNINIIEEMEGITCPQEIKNKRMLARQEIDEIENANDVSNYNLNFGE